MYKLIIGNKRLSSWSMRPWLLMKQLGIPFEEELVPFWQADWHARVRAAAGGAPVPGTVPILLDGALAVGDSLAIAETLAERLPSAAVWPRESGRRALARTLCAEMHAGFAAIRQEFSFDALRSAQPKPPSAAAAGQLARADAIFAAADPAEGFLCGAFSAADAFFAPLALRTLQYSLPLSPAAAAYVQRIAQLPAVQEWIAAASGERAWPMRGPGGRNYFPAVITAEDAARLAQTWIAAWNRRDLEAVLALFAEDAAFVSPKAETFVGRARVEGGPALRDYWTKALAAIPRLEFQLEAADWDPARSAIVVTYLADLAGRRARAVERWLVGADGRIACGEAFYGAALS